MKSFEFDQPGRISQSVAHLPDSRARGLGFDTRSGLSLLLISDRQLPAELLRLVLAKVLGGICLPRNSVIGRPEMTMDVKQQHNNNKLTTQHNSVFNKFFNTFHFLVIRLYTDDTATAFCLHHFFFFFLFVKMLFQEPMISLSLAKFFPSEFLFSILRDC